MKSVVRLDIAPFAVHGGRVDLARAAFPGGEEWIDLSTGIAPWSYPAEIDAAAVAHLPAPAALTRLEAVAGRAFGTDPASVVAVPGSDLALRLLGHELGGRAAVVRPGYGGHVAMWGSAPPLPIGADDILAAAGTVETIVLARPNNPDGSMIDRQRLESATNILAARGGHLIVDEAFFDATPDQSLAGAAWPGLVVLRSFGKFYGLAGLRLGFVIAPPTVVTLLRQMIGDWPISGPAIAIGTAAYADIRWQSEQVARLKTGRVRLDDILARANLRVLGGTDFFRLVQTPARDALFTHLAAAAILTRPFADAPDRLRFGLPRDEAGWARLDRALDH